MDGTQWREFGYFLEAELESAFVNAIYYFQLAHSLQSAGRENEALDNLLTARLTLGRAQGFRDAFGTMRLRETLARSKPGELEGSGGNVVCLFKEESE